MRNKRKASAVLAFVLSLSLALPVSAAELPDSPGSMTQSSDTDAAKEADASIPDAGNSEEEKEVQDEQTEQEESQAEGNAEDGKSEDAKTEESKTAEGTTEDGTAKTALEETEAPIEETGAEALAGSEWTAEDFTYGEISQTMTGCDYQRTINIKGQGITGLSDSGKVKIEGNKHLVIPSAMPDGTTIVGVGSDAFKGMGIETLTLPENMMVSYNDTLTGGAVKERGNFIIQAGAFSNNSLTSMDFPAGVIYIDTYAFRSNQLSSVTFPHTLWMIGNSAFDKNQLTAVNFPAQNDFLFQVDAFAFSNNKLKSITLPYLCEKVDKNTFLFNPGMETVPAEAPEKEKGFGGVVHMYTSNADAKNRDRIHHIERTAESQKSWHQRLIVGTEPEEEVSWKAADFTYSGTTLTGLSESGIARRLNDRDLVLPDKNPDGAYITEIAAGTSTDGVFSSGEEIFDSVKLPSKLLKIGNNAFFKNNLTAITLPGSLTEIGQTAFAQNSIQGVVLPDSVVTLGPGVFSGQKEGALTSVTLSKGLTAIPQSAFANNAITELVIPEGVTSVGRIAFQSSPLTALSLPGTLETIDSNAFKGHELSTLTIPGTVKVITSGAFGQNTVQSGGTGSLQSLNLQEGTEEIASKAFENAGLTKVNIPVSLKKLNKDAFKGGVKGVVSLVTDNYTHLTDKTNFPDSTSHQIKLNTENWKAEDFVYDGATITGLSESGMVKRKENKKLVLPSKNRNGEDITAIAASSGTYGTFGAEGEVFEQVTLPEKLQKIGDKAFLSNHLTAVTFPETLTEIGLQAFALNDLSDIVIPDAVTSLGKGAAFSNNEHIKNIQLGKGLTEIPATTFGITTANTSNAKLVNLVIPEGITSIGSGAFGGHEIQTLALPESLTKIDSRAFKGNQLTSLVIPADVTELGSSAFEQTAGKSTLASVSMKEGLQKINSKVFANAALTRVDVPFSLTTLNKAAFDGNSQGNVAVYTPNDDHLKFQVTGATFTIHVRYDIWTVNDFTFEGTKITGLSERGIRKRAENHNLVLPDKNTAGDYITEIGVPASGTFGTFGAEDNLIESVVLPVKLEKVGDRAFQNNRLTEVTFPETVKEIGLAAFQMNQLTKIVLPDSVTTLGGGAFATNKTLQSIKLSKNLKEIPAGAFGCSTKDDYMVGLTEISIPEGVTSIGDNAFAGNNFTEIRIPTTVISIGRLAFSTKKTLIDKTTLFLPEGLVTIGSFAFRNQNIEQVDLPYTVTGVPENTFLKDYEEGAVTKIRVEGYTQYTDKEKFPDSENHEYVINADRYTTHDFTYDKTIVTGLSDNGQMKRPLNKNLIIPDTTPDKAAVTEIGAGKAGEYGTFGAKEEVFDSVTLPSKLEKIGNFAFRANNIQTMVFPETLTNIGLQSFAENKLTEVILPDSVTTLGGAAFTSNPTLCKVVLSKGLTAIPASVFLNNTAAKGFTSITIPEGVTSIGDSAFAGNSFTEVVIPANVTKIGKSAFAQTPDNATITSVKLPSGLIEMGSKAFKDSLLSRIDIPKGLQKLAKDTFINTKGTKVIVHTSNPAHLTETANQFFPVSEYHETIFDQLVESGWNEADFTYSGSVLTGWSEQGNETRLKNLHLVLPSVNPETGEDLTSIGAEAFKIPDDEWEQGKTGIESPNGMVSVMLPERLVKIESKAFQYNSLKTVTFPETVYSIGESAFNSNKIEELTLPDTITQLQSGAFSTNVIHQLVLSKGITVIPQAAFSMNIELTYVEIPDTITEIGDYAFAGARLETLDIPKSVKRIGKKAFHLHHLTELVIPGNVKEIGESAFEGTFKAITLKKLTLEEGIEKIGPLAFKEGYLETVNLPSSLMSLAADSFYHNAGVNNNYVVECYTSNPAHLKFQNSTFHTIVLRAVTWNIEDFVFGSGKGRAAVIIPETTITGLSASGIEKLKTSTDIILPPKNSKGEVVTAIGDYAFADLPVKLTSVTFAEGLLNIGTGAFTGNAIQDLVLPASLLTIGDEAFAGNRLTEFTLPEKVERIGQSAFDGNTDVDGNTVKVKVYITNENQNNIPGSEGFEIIVKQPETPETPETPKDPSIPTNPVIPDTSGGQAQDQTITPVKQAVQTSDNQMRAGYLVILMAAAWSLMAYAWKKRVIRKDHER